LPVRFFLDFANVNQLDGDRRETLTKMRVSRFCKL